MSSSKLARIALYAGVPMVLMVWEAVARGGVFNRALFPPPSKVVLSLIDMALSGQLFKDALASGQRLAVGYLAGAVLGIALGTLTGRYELARNFFSPIIQLLRPIPPISFVPIAVLWFGLGEFSKYFLVFWGVFFVIWIGTHLGIMRVNRIYVNAAQALGAPDRVVLLEVVLPAALPSVLAAMRTAIPIGFYSLVAGEIAGATHGVAYMIELAHTNFQVDRMFGGLVVLGIGSALADRGFVAVTRAAFPWGYPRTT